MYYFFLAKRTFHPCLCGVAALYFFCLFRALFFWILYVVLWLQYVFKRVCVTHAHTHAPTKIDCDAANKCLSLVMMIFMWAVQHCCNASEYRLCMCVYVIYLLYRILFNVFKILINVFEILFNVHIFEIFFYEIAILFFT